MAIGLSFKIRKAFFHEPCSLVCEFLVFFFIRKTILVPFKTTIRYLFQTVKQFTMILFISSQKFLILKLAGAASGEAWPMHCAAEP